MAAPYGRWGASVAWTPGEAAAGAELIISMVADDRAARELWLGASGALGAAESGAVLVESSTLSSGWIKELAVSAARRGCGFLDAPVTGSKTHAAAGELTFLVGGSAEALAKARPALAALGPAVLHLGATGSGALLKLVNNFLCGVQAVSLAEAFAFIERSRLDRAPSIEFLKNAAPGSPLVRTLAERMEAGRFEPNFKLRLLAKDLAYAVEEGRAMSLELATVSSAIEVLQAAI